MNPIVEILISTFLVCNNDFALALILCVHKSVIDIEIENANLLNITQSSICWPKQVQPRCDALRPLNLVMIRSTS